MVNFSFALFLEYVIFEISIDAYALILASMEIGTSKFEVDVLEIQLERRKMTISSNSIKLK